MLTRIEIDGFKSFSGFALDLAPFTAVIGPNSAGKSNLFDALQFLRLVTDEGLAKAVASARGDLDDLFRRRGDGSRENRMAFNVEVLLDPRVRDPWGSEVALTQTRLRYELAIVRREGTEGNPRLVVDHERVVPLRRGAGDLPKRWRALRAFIDHQIVDGGRKSAYLDTIVESGHRVFKIGQDGVAGRPRPAEAAEASVLSSMNSTEFRHLYALREEIRTWRLLQLEPHALRRPAERFGEDRLSPDGENLARVLARIRSETATIDRPEGLLAEIATDLSVLIPGITSMTARENPQTRRWEIVITARDEGEFRADVASDGTLRVIALLAALYDPRYRGLICFEEPENGVHPGRLAALLKYVKSLVTDPGVLADTWSPLSQVLLNSHSPLVLDTLEPQDCVLLEPASLIETTDASGRRATSRVTQFRRVVADGGEPTLFDTGPLAPTTRSRVQRTWARELLERPA